MSILYNRLRIRKVVPEPEPEPEPIPEPEPEPEPEKKSRFPFVMCVTAFMLISKLV